MFKNTKKKKFEEMSRMLFPVWAVHPDSYGWTLSLLSDWKYSGQGVFQKKDEQDTSS